MNKSYTSKKSSSKKKSNLVLEQSDSKGKFYTVQRNSEHNPNIKNWIKTIVQNEEFNSIRIEGLNAASEDYFPMGGGRVYKNDKEVTDTTPSLFLILFNDLLEEAYQFGSYLNCRVIQNVEICLTSSIQFKSTLGTKQYVVSITELSTTLYQKLKAVVDK